MLVAQAMVEAGFLDTLVSTVSYGVEQAISYVRAGNAKWFLIGLGLIMAILLFKPKR
jgi:hypothetical protein